MSYFEKMDGLGHEELILCRMREAGLRAIIAIHDTTLGPFARRNKDVALFFGRRGHYRRSSACPRHDLQSSRGRD